MRPKLIKARLLLPKIKNDLYYDLLCPTKGASPENENVRDLPELELKLIRRRRPGCFYFRIYNKCVPVCFQFRQGKASNRLN